MTFPGGTSLSFLDVYSDSAPDGLRGGSPHVHLASTEAYVVTHGHGALHTLDRTGFSETPLSAGSVVWFTPGTIHRAVDLDGLQVVVVMSNAGLPEAGDAVMTFPIDVLRDASVYAAAAALPTDADEDASARAAAERRDLAVRGFLDLRERIAAHGVTALEEFYELAGGLVAARAAAWPDLVRGGPLRHATASLDMAEAIARGDVSHLAAGGITVAKERQGPRLFGMCGRLRTYRTDPA